MTSTEDPPAVPPEFAEAFAKAKHRHFRNPKDRFLHYDRAKKSALGAKARVLVEGVSINVRPVSLTPTTPNALAKRERYPNGRLKPLTAAQKRKQKLQEVAAAEIANVASVAAQPHRRDLPVSPLAGSASGRLILRCDLPKGLDDAATVFAKLHRAWHAATGAPLGAKPGASERIDKAQPSPEWHHAHRRGATQEQVDKEFEILRAKVKHAEQIARTHGGEQGLRDLYRLVVDELDAPLDAEAAVIAALEGLAGALGLGPRLTRLGDTPRPRCTNFSLKGTPLNAEEVAKRHRHQTNP
jgi:hypothetical protein